MIFPKDRTRTGIRGVTGLHFCRAANGADSHAIEVWTGAEWVLVLPEAMDEAFKAGAHEAIMAALSNAYGDDPVFPPEDAHRVVVNKIERASGDDLAWEAADNHRAALQARVWELEGEQRAAVSLIRKMAKEVHAGACASPLGFGPCDICRTLRAGDRDLMRAFEWWQRGERRPA